MKLKTLNRVIKNILFITRIRNSMIILKLLLVMHTVYARLELCDIKAIGDSVVVQKGNLLIHPDGSLNPLRGYIMHKSGYMYNKRLYAPEINTEYSLKKINVAVDSANSYKYTRTPVYDKAYENICENKEKNEYLTQFHTQIIRMFPSADGALSIVAGRPDALTSFLIKDEVQPESMYILAAIFLLSEQVNVPIIVNLEEKGNERLVLKSKDGKTTYVDQSLVLHEDITKLKEGHKNHHRETIGVIDFLKGYIDTENMNTCALIGGHAEPTTYEQFMTGNFLNTPQFLAQSYIYEFIDTKDEYIEFVKAVYTLLNDQMNGEKSTEENKVRCNELLERLFIEKGKFSDLTDHTTIICDLKKTVDTYTSFPFNNSSQLPSYGRVKAYNRDTNTIIDDRYMMYSSCVETSILGIFCCLMYDPAKKKYATGNIPINEKTKQFKKFFKDYPKPIETTDYNMQQEWCKVVSDLKNNNIFYMKQGTNELDSSLLNILYVMSDITGNKKEVFEEIEKIESMCISKNLGKQLDIEKNLTNIFKELSNNKNLKVKSENFKVYKRENGKLDFFGAINLEYTFNGMKNGILIDISPDHAELKLMCGFDLNESDEAIEEKLNEIKDVYKSTDKYTGQIIRQYIDIEISMLYGVLGYLEDESEKKMHDSINKGGDDVLSLLLNGKIESISYKSHIVTCFLVLHVNRSLNKNCSLVRFTSNIIGSVPLNDFSTREKILISSVYNTHSKKYYSRIKKCWGDISKCDVGRVKIIITNLLGASLYPQKIILECFNNLMKAVGASEDAYNIITDQDSMISRMIRVSNYDKNPIEIFSRMLHNINESFARLGMQKMTNLYLIWFIDAGTSNIIQNNIFMKYIFEHIDKKYLDSSNEKPNSNRWTSEMIYEILRYLTNNMNLICEDTNTESIEKYIVIIDKIKKIYRHLVIINR
ncbi:hypothetical protein NEIG_01046 [Nematocida sp. ERTm5]|nr:hypothetical protein NEIG_01046 [Nematocida sp. ERTm5]